MRAIILTLVVLILLAGCSSVPSLLYKIEIQQGNVITQEMVDKLKPGMTRSQVRFALGSPMISDAFHDNRWDYVYRLEQEGRLVEQRQLTVFFDGDELVRIDGSFKPSVAFVPTHPVEGSAPIEPAMPMATEDSKDERGFPVSSEITGANGQDSNSISAIELPAVSDASNLPASGEPGPRQVPSRAEDKGGREADQLKD